MRVINSDGRISPGIALRAGALRAIVFSPRRVTVGSQVASTFVVATAGTVAGAAIRAVTHDSGDREREDKQFVQHFYRLVQSLGQGV